MDNITVQSSAPPQLDIQQVPPPTQTATVGALQPNAVVPNAPTTVTWDQVTGKPAFGTAALRNINPGGDALSNQVVLGVDSRLTNARPPLSHTHVLSDITDMSAFGRTWAQYADAATAAAALGVPTPSSPLPINAGGTGANTKTGAQTNLSIPTSAADIGALAKAGDSMTGVLGLNAWQTITTTGANQNLNLSAATSNLILLNSTGSINTVTVPANRVFYVKANNGFTMVSNPPSLRVPRNADFAVSGDDVFILVSTALNNVQLLPVNRQTGYVYRDGDKLTGALANATEIQVASAATVDLSLAGANGNDLEITGTTDISNFGTASPIGAWRTLRFLNATPGKLINGVAPGGINTPNGVDLVVKQYDTVRVRKVPSGLWWATEVIPGNSAFNWEKIIAWSPTAVNSIDFTWTPGRYSRVRVSIVGVKKSGAGTSGEDFYMRIIQGGAAKGGAIDYWLHAATWAATGGTVADTVFGYLQMTNGGHGATPEEFSGEIVVDCNDQTRPGVTGITRWLNNGGQRCVSIHGHQVLVNDAVSDGVRFGFVGTGSFVAGLGRIVVEGLRK